eukprot:TRINITY_DN8103_c0_g1_i3.p1 TRINITY_DN8103_c0_g1~~TRINITY_DN8103_c0_g1_i3.p1  ORF type:complete len:345 (+),score=88.36 TRINITY_DN8103_c0_g1_i3:61-1035(+)
MVATLGWLLVRAKQTRPLTSRDHVLVTGASSGIGRYTALYLINKVGIHVIATVRREEDGSALRDLLDGSHKDKLHIIILDVTKDQDIQKAVKGVESILGGDGLLCGVFNNAGGNPNACLSIEDTPIEVYTSIMDLNFTGTVKVTKAFLPLLRKSKGPIINNSSFAGLLALIFLQPYSASKAAIESFTDTLRREVARFGIRVVIIEPGMVWSNSPDKHLQTMPKEGDYSRDLYPDTVPVNIANFNSGQKQASSPLVIARFVEAALTARYPRTRYAGGGFAFLGVMVSRLPGQVQDLLLALTLPRETTLHAKLNNPNRPDKDFTFR